MMTVKPIVNPMDGEVVVGQFSTMDAGIPTHWHRRLNLFTGRSLTAPALEVEQKGRAGRVAASGQLVSPGVVTGLEVGFEREVMGAESVRYWYHVTPGLGVCMTGEDVFIPTTLRVMISSVPWVGPQLSTGPAGGPAQSAGVLILRPTIARIDFRPDPEDACEQDPANYAFEDWQQVDASVLYFFPWPAENFPVLPVNGAQWRNRIAYTIFDVERQLGPNDALPWEEVGVPIALVGFNDQGAPIFVDRAAVVRAGGKPRRRVHLIPNPEVENQQPILLSDVGTPFLWQARIQQFAEHLADPALANTAISALASEFRYLPPVGVLPKSAVDTRLPTDTSGPRTGRNHFFPNQFQLDAAPVPQEQLDLVLESSASLRPFDTSSVEQVRVLVPVPQRWYESELLHVEKVDPEFQQTIARFVAKRADWLRRRANVRQKQTAIVRATTGASPKYPDPDPEQLEPETFELTLPFVAARVHKSQQVSGFHQHYFQNATTTLLVNPVDILFVYVQIDPDYPPTTLMLQWRDSGGSWEHRAYWGANELNFGVDGTASRRAMGALPPLGQWVRLEVVGAQVGLTENAVNGMAFTLNNGRAAWGPAGSVPPGQGDVIWIANDTPTGAQLLSDHEGWEWDDPQMPFEDSFQTNLTTSGARVVTLLETLRAAVQTAAPLTAEELAELDTQGIEGFIGFLEDKVNRANDAIDLGFLRSQTDIYRIRQLMLGNDAASRLATSPVLAAIAKGESAVATREAIDAFQERIRQTPPATERVVAPEGTSSSGPNLLFIDRLGSGQRVNVSGMRVSPAITLSETLASIGSVQKIQKASVLDMVKESTSADVLKVKLPTRDDVLDQLPIIGEVNDFRTATISERLQKPPAEEARSYTIASKHDVLVGATNNIPLFLDDLAVPGVLKTEGSQTTNVRFGDLRNRATGNQILDDVLRGLHDRVKDNPDEAEFFSSGVRAVEHTVATLRVIEGRIHQYRLAIIACREILGQLRGVATQVESRLNVVADELAEARYDVSVARALLAEEQARITRINERRNQIIAEHVSFLVFYRPRLSEAVVSDMPTRGLDPGLLESPVPKCLASGVAVPAELRAMVDLLREAPIKWFPHIQPLLSRLDRLEVLLGTVQSAKIRAQTRSLAGPVLLQPTALTKATRLAQAVTSVFTAQYQMVTQYRTQLAQLDLGLFAGKSWAQAQAQAQETLSVGDVIDAGHGRNDLAQLAAQELADIAEVASCLYTHFGDVLPVLRLEWAERLSQYDAPVNLRNLASLPRWGEISYLERRAMQTLVDWLFQQIDPRQPEVVGLMNDLVRMSILLASHAPVNQIITGHLPQPTNVEPGKRVEVAIDPERVRVGMHVLMYAGSEVVARAVVEDLSADKAAARIVQTTRANVQLEKDARVRFTEPDALDRTPLQFGMRKR